MMSEALGSRAPRRTRTGAGAASTQSSRQEGSSASILSAARHAARAAFTTERIRSSPIAQAAIPPCKWLTPRRASPAFLQSRCSRLPLSSPFIFLKWDFPRTRPRALPFPALPFLAFLFRAI